MISYIKKIIKNRFVSQYFLYIRILGRLRFLFLNDKSFLERKYFANFHSKPDFNSPRKYNEHIASITLQYRDPLAVSCADKYSVRDYAKQMGLDHLLNECFGVYSTAEEVIKDLKNLPDQFVLKATHGCGWNLICSDKNQLQLKQLRVELDHWLKSNFYFAQREWLYKNIPPRIIAEKYLEDESGELRDYKFHCHFGEPKYINVISGRRSEIVLNTYDVDWNYIDVNYGPSYPNNKNQLIEKPLILDDLLKYCRILSKNFNYVRVDFYIVNRKPVFGELTFTPGNGTYHFSEEQDLFFGSFFIQNKDKLI